MHKIEEEYQKRYERRSRFTKYAKEMRLTELCEYLMDLELELDGVQTLLYEWSILPAEKATLVPMRVIRSIGQDIGFLSGEIASIRDRLQRTVSDDNSNGFFAYNVAKTLDKLYDGCDLVLSFRAETEEEEQEIVKRLTETRDLIDYWEHILKEGGYEVEKRN